MVVTPSAWRHGRRPATVLAKDRPSHDSRDDVTGWTLPARCRPRRIRAERKYGRRRAKESQA